MLARIPILVFVFSAPLMFGNSDPEIDEPLVEFDSEPDIRTMFRHDDDTEFDSNVETGNVPRRLDASRHLSTPGNCRDTYERVMQENGGAYFLRKNAAQGTNHFIRAVDYDMDDCDVMLTSEGVRPLPRRPAEDAPLLYRAQ